MASFEGDFRAPTGKFALVAARFNARVVDSLLAGTMDGLRRHGVAEANIDVARVPGALEIPLVARKLAESGRYVAIVCLGAVIRGETGHYDIVAGESARGVAQVSADASIPVVNAILTTDTFEQAVNRAGGKAGNKGAEAAAVAIEMVNLLAQLGGSP